MTDIESKLSAIKAINEEKENCDSGIESLSKQIDQNSDEVLYKVPIPAAIMVKLHGTLLEYLLQRKRELIAKAEAIMKSEDPPPATGNR